MTQPKKGIHPRDIVELCSGGIGARLSAEEKKANQPKTHGRCTSDPGLAPIRADAAYIECSFCQAVNRRDKSTG